MKSLSCTPIIGSALRTGKTAGLALAALFMTLPNLVLAQDLDTGDTSWMIVATVLVLLMTIPGLSLFYAGMVRTKNVLSVFMQCFAITALMSVLWVIYGYSMAFDTTGMEAGVTNLSSFIGGLDKAMLSGVTVDSLVGTIPESVFATFQMTFAIITPALIVGAFAERIKFSSMLVFMTAWFTICYVPMVHMVWSGDGAFLWDLGVLDFAGGTVVHINAGIAGLVACLLIGKRKGFPGSAMPPHNLTYTIMGAALLWVGWFGFNAGSAVAANGTAGMAITPASGAVGPAGALFIGLIAGVICFLSATKLKRLFGYDDSLDVFGVHAVGGIVGAILTGVFAAESFGGVGLADGIAAQVWIQFESVVFTVVYTGVFTAIIFKVIDATMGMRVSEEAESEGLDLASHNERGYVL